MSDVFEQRASELIAAGRRLYERGLVPATSGNLSARLEGGDVAITVSGRDKGRLEPDDIMRVDAAGEPLDARRPSAETLLHVQIYNRFPRARFVLHPHSPRATVLSRIAGDTLSLSGYELLKVFPGIDTHATELTVPVFDNDQDIGRLAAVVEKALPAAAEGEPARVYGYLIRGHGYYTWGDSMEQALRHVEAFEFLFECELRERGR